MKLTRSCNCYLDKLVRWRFLHRQKVPAYGLLVYLGIVAGFSSASVFAVLFRLPFVPLLIAAGSGLLAAVVLAYVTRIVAGDEVYSFYHYQLAVMMAAAVLLECLKRPALVNLDVLILSLGITHACGRLGCLVAGCCFGRPRSWGVCYSSKHAANGFPYCLVGVRLLPIQLIESIWILLSVATGVLVTMRGAPPGSALSWYTVMYGSGRFVFEFQRMDTTRRVGQFTEAQLTSVTLIVSVMVCELIGLLPFQPYHGWAAVLLLTICLYQWIRKSESALLSGQHVLELAAVTRAATNNNVGRGTASTVSVENVDVERTSLGLLISGGRFAGPQGPLLHYSISRDRGTLTDRTARRVAGMLARLNCSETVRLVRSSNVYHALIFIGATRNRDTN